MKRPDVALRKRIDREILEHDPVIAGEHQGLAFLNNFHCHLPGGYLRNISEDLLEDRLPVSREWEGGRILRRSQFYAVIDKFIAELHLDADKIKELREGQDPDKFFAYIFPLYVRLREAGFKHYPDLTA
jgi:hypothetical protein